MKSKLGTGEGALQLLSPLRLDHSRPNLGPAINGSKDISI